MCRPTIACLDLAFIMPVPGAYLLVQQLDEALLSGKCTGISPNLGDRQVCGNYLGEGDIETARSRGTCNRRGRGHQ